MADANRVISGKSMNGKDTGQQTAKVSGSDFVRGIRPQGRSSASEPHGFILLGYYCRVGLVPRGCKRCHKSPAFMWENMWEK